MHKFLWNSIIFLYDFSLVEFRKKTKLQGIKNRVKG